MFITFPAEDRLGSSNPEWLAAWNAALSRARALAASPDGHWMFHGTTLDRAQAIVLEGFRCPCGNVPAARNHVYWGPLGMALNFADRGYGRPALLAARLADVLASGVPLPMTAFDRQMEEGSPELPDWQASVAESGALRVLGGARVQGMLILGENQ